MFVFVIDVHLLRQERLRVLFRAVPFVDAVHIGRVGDFGAEVEDFRATQVQFPPWRVLPAGRRAFFMA